MTKDEELDHTPLDFGKYRGQTPDQIAAIDPGYVVWLRREVYPPIVSRLLASECEKELPSRYSPVDWGD